MTSSYFISAKVPGEENKVTPIFEENSYKNSLLIIKLPLSDLLLFRIKNEEKHDRLEDYYKNKVIPSIRK